MFFRLVSVIAFTFIFSSAHAISVNRSVNLSCQYIIPLQNRFIAGHIKPPKSGAELERRTIENFVKKLDPIKVYLLKSDVKRIEILMRGIFVKAKNKNCKSIRASHDVFKERAKARISSVSYTHLTLPTICSV